MNTEKEERGWKPRLQEKPAPTRIKAQKEERGWKPRLQECPAYAHQGTEGGAGLETPPTNILLRGKRGWEACLQEGDGI